MKVVIAPDSFRNSLSVGGVAAAIALSLAQVWAQAQLIKCPMATTRATAFESDLDEVRLIVECPLTLL